jgi:hypothetical protein
VQGFVGTPEGKRPLGGPMRRCVGEKTGSEGGWGRFGVGGGGVDLMRLAQDRDR